MSKIRIGIVGYGNLGKSVETGIRQNDDMELIGIFTRREPSTIKTQIKESKVYHIDQAKDLVNDIDVIILCGGSKNDIPNQAPLFASMFNTVDGYDTHAKIPEYFDVIDRITKESGKTSIISSGWDPGMFSLNRLYAQAILPVGQTHTFWGKGVSQGHSDAVRGVDGVKDAVQYTIPIDRAIDSIKKGESPHLLASEKHKRECYVLAEDGADKERIEKDIKTMPNYFADYDTQVYFITDEELKRDHAGIPHGGLVIHHGQTGLNNENNHIIEYNIKLESNPDFTASVLIAYARAAYRLNKEGNFGAKTVVDIAPVYLSSKSAEDIRKELI